MENDPLKESHAFSWLYHECKTEQKQNPIISDQSLFNYTPIFIKMQQFNMLVCTKTAYFSDLDKSLSLRSTVNWNGYS